LGDNIIAGLISGITITFLILVVRKFWDAVVVPWFEERVYKDVKIEGKWFALYPYEISLRQELIVLKRHGHSITGTMICTNGPDEGSEYSLCGSFRNMLLPLIYESTNEAMTDRGTITLICVQNGEKLNGKLALYNNRKDAITSGNVIWFRSKEEVSKAIEEIKLREKEIEKLREENLDIAQKESEIESTFEENVIEGEKVSEIEEADSEESAPDK
jgi:FtsZ-binding cell division protein ZapB